MQGEKGTFGIRNKVVRSHFLHYCPHRPHLPLTLPTQGSVLGRESTAQSSRDATPLSSLRDPSSFAPPPKRILPPPGQSQAALTQYGHEEAVDEPPPPPRPYRVDTTGLSTSNLPPPPRRADGVSPVHASGSPPPPPYTRSTVGAGAKPPPPSLPPRLPPRQNTASPVAEVPSRQAGFLNQGAMDRLGAAGVSVPGLGINGNSGRPALPPPSGGRSSPKPPSPAGSGMSELQSRFGKFGVGGGSNPGSGLGGAASPPPAPAQGTTWAQKQAALKTMSDFKKNPSSVSLTDAKSAASTANNFRQRHGEQVASGVKTANGLDQKYGVSGKVGGYLGNGNESAGGSGAAAVGHTVGAQSHLNTIGAAAGVLGKKKPPPPPPPKRKSPVGADDGARDDAPPPVPMATRPIF